MSSFLCNLWFWVGVMVVVNGGLVWLNWGPVVLAQMMPIAAQHQPASSPLPTSLPDSKGQVLGDHMQLLVANASVSAEPAQLELGYCKNKDKDHHILTPKKAAVCIAAALTTHATTDLYAQLSGQLTETFSRADVDQAFGDAAITAIEPQGDAVVRGEWASLPVLVTSSTGQSRYTMVLHQEADDWKLFGTMDE